VNNEIREKVMTIYTTAKGTTYSVVENTLPIVGNAGNSNVVITDPNGSVVYSNSALADGNIISGSGSTLNLASALVGQTFVVLPDASATVTVAASLATLTNNVFWIGGAATLNIAASVLSGTTVNVDGGSASLSSGSVASALSGTTVNISNGGTFSNGASLINALSGATVAFGTGGGTFVVNTGGAAINLGSSTITNYNPAQDTIEFAGISAQVVAYAVTASNSARTVTLLGTNGAILGSYTATLATGASLAGGTYSVGSSNNPLKITYSNGNTYIGTCYLTGTMIRTDNGERPIEAFRVGDSVTAFDSAGASTERTVVWVGSNHAVVRPDLPDDEAGYPVRIRAGALDEQVPVRDLLVTPEHCLYLNGGFIPARMLVNGRSIVYDQTITTYDYHHIETLAHSIILAEGAKSESYLDTGNRATFREASGITRIGGQYRAWDDAAAPLTVSRSVVEPVFRRILSRVSTSEPLSNDTALHADPDLQILSEGGIQLRRLRVTDAGILFQLPPDIDRVRLTSRTARPCDVDGPFVDDRRTLGILVGRVTLFESDCTRVIRSHLDDADAEGWDVIENTPCRWTHGHALLHIGTRTVGSLGILCIEILAGGPYRERSSLTVERRQA